MLSSDLLDSATESLALLEATLQVSGWILGWFAAALQHRSPGCLESDHEFLVSNIQLSASVSPVHSIETSF